MLHRYTTHSAGTGAKILRNSTGQPGTVGQSVTVATCDTGELAEAAALALGHLHDHLTLLWEHRVRTVGEPIPYLRRDVLAVLDGQAPAQPLEPAYTGPLLALVPQLAASKPAVARAIREEFGHLLAGTEDVWVEATFYVDGFPSGPYPITRWLAEQDDQVVQRTLAALADNHGELYEDDARSVDTWLLVHADGWDLIHDNSLWDEIDNWGSPDVYVDGDQLHAWVARNRPHLARLAG